MKQDQLIDHLFRHQYGGMVSVLTRIFGLSHLETIEDAVQDTFATAMLKWRRQVPDNPEGWLIRAAKNRAIDLLRKIKADHHRLEKLDHGAAVLTLNELFLDHEIEDSQLRMIFTACHPDLDERDQIAFALKTISGFSTKEIAAALLLKEETVKKRLSRARQAIRTKGISFALPGERAVRSRLRRVLQVLYLIFNEGFHSLHQSMLIRKDLCGEAIRLARLILRKPAFRTGASYALFAFFCFQASRLESKVAEDHRLVDLRQQDRSKWYFPLIRLGNDAMNKAMEYADSSPYHLEAAIAAEHLRAPSFEATDWHRVLELYQRLYNMQPDPLTLLNMAIVHLQLAQYPQVLDMLKLVEPTQLEQRAYLYYGLKAEYFSCTNQNQQAIKCIDQALGTVSNEAERAYLLRKRQQLAEKGQGEREG
ncbi:MAG: sigma-70 family RNA polymerase sigma factor [Bacteroidetes bacterium]|nr:MAG: sigma-70 family RNA polymerase sigma factor [Bacteroidota bacterium]